MTDIDAQAIFDQIKELAVGQTELRVHLENESQANMIEHGEIIDYQRTQNGNMEELAVEYHADKQVRELEDAKRQIVDELVETWGRRVGGAVLASAVIVPAVWLLIGQITGIGGG